MNVVIVGLGYVGLPLAVSAAVSGLRVHGLDTNGEVVSRLEQGRSHIDDVTDDEVSRARAGGFAPTNDPSVIRDADIVVICVPTPLSRSGGPDLGFVEAAGTWIAPHLRPGVTVILESTTYPGTTDEVLRPLLDRPGFSAGQDYHLAFSPERIDPGNAHFGPVNTPKVVGGYTPACRDRAAKFYAHFIDTVVTTKGLREAEMSKILENTYRHVNIALVNELAQVCHELDIDLWDAIDAAATKPFGFQAFRPGPGVGGHCIPIDPNYLSFQVRTQLGYPLRVVELAQEVNQSMPRYIVSRVSELLNARGKSVSGSRIAILGVTYKPNISDARETPVEPIVADLVRRKADVHWHDPLVGAWDEAPVGAQRWVGDPIPLVRGADLTLLLQNHRDYDLDVLTAEATQLFDTRGVTVTEGERVSRL